MVRELTAGFAAMAFRKTGKVASLGRKNFPVGS
jgi:hypothetical protein